MPLSAKMFAKRISFAGHVLRLSPHIPRLYTGGPKGGEKETMGVLEGQPPGVLRSLTPFSPPLGPPV